MDRAHEIGGDILAAATALAGLLLVFMGAVSTTYDSYATAQKSAVRPKYRRRVWLAFAGFILSVAAAAFALAAKWFDCSGLVNVSVTLLLIGFAIAVIAALRAALDIN
jgi:hypothetical protein